MKQLTNIIIFTLVTLAANAQNGIFIPKGANVAFFGENATAFSNVENNGNLTINSGAVVNFEGQNWTNDVKAQINGDGTVRFTSSNNEAQQIDGGYNAAISKGAAFGTLEVANKGGIELKNSNAKVRNELNLKNKVIVNDNILVAGGKITGANGNINVKSVVIWNIVGVKMTQQAVNGQSILEVKGLVPGTYVIGFIGENGQNIESRKVVVAGYSDIGSFRNGTR